MLDGTKDADWLAYSASCFEPGADCGFKHVGKNVKIYGDVRIPHPERISIGDNVRIDTGTILTAQEIVIGNNVHIGSYCVLSGPGKIEFQDFSSMSHQSAIFTATDDLDVPSLTNTTVPPELQALIVGDVLIEKHAIIGLQSAVMPGVTLGFGSVLGGKSLLKMNVRPYTIVAGVPAKFIRARPKHVTPEALAELERRCREASA